MRLLVWGSKSCPLKRILSEPWAHLVLGWIGLGSLPARRETSGAGANRPCDGCASWAVWDEKGRLGGWELVSSLLKGSPWLRTETCHSQAPRVCPIGWAGPGSLRIKGVNRKLPEYFLWFCFLGVGAQSFSSHWSSACQNKKLWFCVVTIFFF